jgi:hypothetical protein
MLRWPGSGVLLGGVPAVLTAQQQPPPETASQQRPVFRGGAHYVRVDAYPRSRDGRIIEGLTKDDFEVYEDGRLQALDRAAFITFDTWTPEAERKEPVVFRIDSRIGPRPESVLHVDRTARVRIDWPLLRTADHHEARLLDRTGRPLPAGLPLATHPGSRSASVELPLSALGRGDYLVELTVSCSRCE